MIRAPLNLSALVAGQQPQATPVAFNPKSEALLGQVNPDLAALLRRVEAQMPDAFEISEGLRDPARQAQMVAEGKSQTYNSKHLHGNAVDIYAEGPGGQPNWDFEAYRPIADAAKAEAASMGLGDFVWGGDWKTLKDGVHFQLGGSSGAPTGVAGAGAAGIGFAPGTPAAPTAQQAGLAAMFGMDPLGALPFGQPVQQGRTMLAQADERAPSVQERRRLALADLIRF
jgi:peptidoglycan LD-endopeptidase CwlK